MTMSEMFEVLKAQTEMIPNVTMTNIINDDPNELISAHVRYKGEWEYTVCVYPGAVSPLYFEVYTPEQAENSDPDPVYETMNAFALDTWLQAHLGEGDQNQ